MSIELAKLVVTVAAGGSTGTGTFSACPTGYVEEIYLDYGQTAGTTDVTITEAGRSQPILTVSNTPTDGVYYPRAYACTTSGANIGTEGVVPIAIAAPLYVSVAQANPATAAVTVYAKIRTV